MSNFNLSLFDEDLFSPVLLDSFFDSNMFRSNLLNTDIIEHNNDYELIMDVPGVKKENINIDLKDGYLTVYVEYNNEKDTKYVRREREYKKYSRSFYIGNVDENNIKARLDNGELHLTVPKEEIKEKKKIISIE